jgi:hypothetical protein
MTCKNRRKEVPCFDELGVLFCGLKASPVAWTSFVEALGKIIAFFKL